VVRYGSAACRLGVQGRHGLHGQPCGSPGRRPRRTARSCSPAFRPGRCRCAIVSVPGSCCWQPKRSGSRGALLRPGPLRTVLATHHRTRLKQAGQGRSVRRDPSTLRRPSVRSPPKRRPTCPRVLTPHRPRHLAHLTLSAPFRVGHQARIRPVIRRPRRWRPTPCLVFGFLSPFGAPAFASGSSCPAEELASPYGRLTGTRFDACGRTSTGFPRSARASCDRGGCPLYPEDHGAHPAGVGRPAGVCRFTAASPWTPLERPIGGASRNEASSRVHWHSPVRSSPSPVAAGWNSRPLGLIT
jgi:hypothetical protein